MSLYFAANISLRLDVSSCKARRFLSSRSPVDRVAPSNYATADYVLPILLADRRPHNDDFAKNIAANIHDFSVARSLASSFHDLRWDFSPDPLFSRASIRFVSKCRFEFPRDTVKYIGTRESERALITRRSRAIVAFLMPSCRRESARRFALARSRRHVTSLAQRVDNDAQIRRASGVRPPARRCETCR